MAANQNFFYREPSAAVGKAVTDMGIIDTGLPIKEIQNYEFSLTIGGSVACIHGGFQGKYQYDEFRASTTGYLTGASVTIEGTAGSLVRVEAKWKIHRDVLDAVDKAFLQIGAKGSVTYKREGTGGTSATHVIRVYDCSFTINKDNTVDVSVKCIGASQGIFYINLYAGFKSAFGSLKFRPDYNDDGLQLLACQNLVDLIDHTVQTDTGTMTNSDFAPIDCSNPGRGWKIRWDKIRGDKMFASEYGFDQDLSVQDIRGIYVTLGWVIGNINESLKTVKIQGGTTPNIILKATADMYYDPIKWIPSANPIECIFSYAADVDPIFYYNQPGVQPTDLDLGYDALGADHNAFPIDKGGLGNILINRNVIAGIVKESTAIKTSPGIIKMFPLKEYYMRIDTFFDKLLSVINANSGGALDLILTLDPDRALEGNGSDLFIINNRGIEKKSAEYAFKKGMVAIRDVSITSKVPSATAAAAFSADTNSAGGMPDASDNAAANAVSSKSAAQSTDIPSFQDLKDAMGTAAATAFSSETVDGLRSVIRTAVNGQSTESTLKKTSVLWPLELKLTIVGVAGWRFGDTITYDDLPARYKDSETGNIKVGFTMTRVTHTFGDEWTTDLTAQCRFVGQ